MNKINRLELIAKTDALKGKRVIVTGCGFKPAEYTFYNKIDGMPSHDALYMNGKEMKMNIGTAIAGVLAMNGATVHMVSRSDDKLAQIKNSLDELIGNKIQTEYSALDVLNEGEVKNFVETISKDKPIYWVQSVGLGAGSYKLKDDNPYLQLEQIPLELLEKESEIVLRATHLMMKELLPHMRKQNESRIGIITSMSAIRGYSLGGTHCAAKGAIDRYTNSAMLGLYKDKIYVTAIRPGGVDTGLYDASVVQDACKNVADEYNCPWREDGIRLAPPTSVGEAVKFAMTTPAHIPSLNLVAQGQFPHEGS